ncbi:MAG: hypothetical protein R2818_15450 [Flavobacteriales bacterium]
MKRLILGLVALLCGLFPASINGCGPDYTTSEDVRFWLLQPQLADAHALHPFYFTTEQLFDLDHDLINTLSYDPNIAEWQAIVGKDVNAEMIGMILYGITPKDYFENERDLFLSNPFLLRLKKLRKGWPDYISYAKRCETLVSHGDPWGFEQHDVDGISRAWDDGLLLLGRARDPQLRARLAYQLIRLAHYGNVAMEVPQRVYEQHLIPLRGKSWLEPSAAFYLASMLPSTERDLAYAELLDRATDKQFRMVQLFNFREADRYLDLATNDRQRANLLVMRDLQHPGRALADLERIHALDPCNRHLPMLLGREVNKLEDWLLTPTLTDYNAAINFWSAPLDPPLTEEQIQQADLDYLREVREFIDRVTVDATPEMRPQFELLNGHLALVSGNTEACRSLMERVDRDPNSTVRMRAQAGLDRILAAVITNERLTDATRADILALVELANSTVEWTDSRTLLDQLHLYLGKKLIERGEVAEGLFLLARSERRYGTVTPLWFSKNARHLAFEIATPADYDRMIAYLDKSDKTPFERYLTGSDERPDGWDRTEIAFRSNELTREKLLDYKATWYVNADRLEEALAILKQVPDAFWEEYPYANFSGDDPFVVDLEDQHNTEHRDKGRYNKRTILERMIALKREARTDPSKRALNNYLLGNAYYNMTWHGKYWIMSRIGWSMWEMSEWRDREYAGPTDGAYFGCAKAKPYYVAAMKYAKDPVLKAMACRMAGECEANWLSFQGEGGLDEWENPHAAALKDGKSREAYRAITECTGYRDFVARFR